MKREIEVRPSIFASAVEGRKIHYGRRTDHSWRLFFSGGGTEDLLRWAEKVVPASLDIRAENSSC